MDIVIWIILFLTIVNFIFTLSISRFLIIFAAFVQKKLEKLEGEPPVNMSREDSGLIDVEGVYNYDPRFVNPMNEK